MYPIILTNLAGKKAVVVGGGPVGERKVRGLLAAETAVTLISPEATQRLQAWAEKGKIVWEKRPFSPTDLDNITLVFAATNERSVNEQIAQEANKRDLLCNVADAPDEGNFHVPAVHRGEDALITVSTYGKNPGKSRQLRDKIAGTFFAKPPKAEKKNLQSARKKAIKKGLVIVNTGAGKGKTTAALGVMLRAWGRNMRVGLLQYLKNVNARYGEVRAAERMDIKRIGLGDGWTWTSKDMTETEARAISGWELAKEHIISDEYDVLILDEFTYPLHFGWLDTNEVLNWLRDNKPEMLHLIITGRDAPPELIAYADLVTEMRNVKHPLETQGIRAQKGIEF